MTRPRRWRLVRGEAASGRRLLPVRRLVAVGATLAIVVGLLGWLVFGSPALGVREVEVTGSVIAPADAVRAVAAVPIGTPLARVDLGAVGDRVRALPSVASVAVRRSWPDTLVIAVTERVAVGAVAVAGGFDLLDATGVSFETVASPPPGVVLLGLATPSPQDPATLAALTVVAALTPQLRALAVQVSAESPYALRLLLADGRVVVWGDSSDSATKARVATALLPVSVGRSTIDVSAPSVATTA